MRGKDAAGDAKAEHEGVLSGGDVEEAMVLEAKAIVFRGRRVAIAVLEDAVPEGERIALVLPALLPAELGDGNIEPCWLGFGLVGEAGVGIGGDEAVCGVADKGNDAALRDSSEEALKIFLLLGGELSRID